VLVFAQPQEVIGADFPGQSESFRAHAQPFAGHPLAFIVVVANAEVFVEVFPRVLEFVLRLYCDHVPDITRTLCGFCVAATLARTRFVVNCAHE